MSASIEQRAQEVNVATDQSVMEVTIKKLLKQNKSKLVSEQKYWYPLSTVTYDHEEVMAVLDSMLKFQTTMGPKVASFECQFAKWLNLKHAIMVNSGSSADLLACFALVTPSCRLLNPGDEILIPALTWPTHIWSAVMAGLTVRTIDIDPDTLNVTPEIIQSEITESTKAVFLVHLMGNPCNNIAIKAICDKHNILLLEDCCESLGATFDGRHVGTFGLAGTFSFFFSHHLVTMEGGMVVTNDDDYADCVRILRAHGWCRNVRRPKVSLPIDIDSRFLFLDWGFNVRPMEIQGACGEIQLKRQETFRKSRIEQFQALKKALSVYPDIILPMVLPKADPCWMFVPLVVKPNPMFTKKDLVGFLEKAGVETRPVIVGDFSQQPAAEFYSFLTASKHPGVEYIHNNGFTVGLHPSVNTDDQFRDRMHDIKKLAATFQKFFEHAVSCTID